MNQSSSAAERLVYLAEVAAREVEYLAQTDQRLFAAGFGLDDVARLPKEPDLAERVDAFVARFGRLQDTLAGALPPRLLTAQAESVGTVLDNLIRAERLGWVRSATHWATLRQLRNRMVHEYVEDPQDLVDALLAAHESVADLKSASIAMGDRVQALLRAGTLRISPTTSASSSTSPTGSR